MDAPKQNIDKLLVVSDRLDMMHIHKRNLGLLKALYVVMNVKSCMLNKIMQAFFLSYIQKSRSLSREV